MSTRKDAVSVDASRPPVDPLAVQNLPEPVSILRAAAEVFAIGGGLSEQLICQKATLYDPVETNYRHWPYFGNGAFSRRNRGMVACGTGTEAGF